MTTISIIGRGIGAPLAACCVAACAPGALIALYCGDGELQQGLEPVVLDNLPPAIRDAVEPLIVRQWNAFSIVRHGQQSRHSADIALIDPLQLGLELDRLRERVAVYRSDGAGRGEATGDLRLEVSSRMADPAGSVLQAEAAKALAAPVLADFDVAEASGLVFQYFPLSGGDVLVRHCALHAHAGNAAQGAQGSEARAGAIVAGAILRATGEANLAIDQALEFAGRFKFR